MDPKILLFIIKLITSGIVSFLAILLMSKMREVGWTFVVCGFLFSYAAMIFELLSDLGIIALQELLILGIPLSSLICTALPTLCFIIGFIILLARRK